MKQTLNKLILFIFCLSICLSFPSYSQFRFSQIKVQGNNNTDVNTIKSKSGYRKYGKGKDEAKKLYDLAVTLDKLGAQVILIECLENSLARKISQNCSAPVIGIGSGVGIDLSLIHI